MLKLKYTLALFISLSSVFVSISQTPLSSIGCPAIDKRSNGNGQASSAAGDFRPTYTQNNPVAPNVTGTSYQLVPFNPQSKTGNFNFRWAATAEINYLPVISRVWTTPVGSENAVLSPIKFGPPPPLYTAGNFKYANYCFYVQNMPNAGRVTLEFLDPQTNSDIYWCTFDLGTGASAPHPTNFSCAPSITADPVSQTFCGDGSVTFSAAMTGQTSFKWQQLIGSTWTDITAGGDFATVTATTLTINNRATYAGKQFRVQGINSCGTTTSLVATLNVNPLPTAVFTGSTALCGLNIARNLPVSFTGVGPWTFTYTVNGTPTTITNTTLNPYNISVNPSEATTYVITSVTDSRCANSSPSGNTTLSINATPTITPSNASACLGSNNFSLGFSSTLSPNQYSISTGTRAMTGFSAISNASLGSSPVSITIPTSGFTAGDYDFNISVRNSTTGCSSSAVPFIVTVNPQPTVSATASSYTICAGTTANLSASPSNLASYEWTLNPSSTVIGTSSTLNFTINSTATFTVKGTNAGGCFNTAQVTVNTITGSPITITPSSPTICSGNAIELQATGSNTYSWSPSLGLSVTNDDHTVASPTTTTTYTVTGQNSEGCNSIGTVVVTVSTAPISVTASSTICSGGNQTLTASGGTTYAWFPYTDLFTDAGFTTAYTGDNRTTVYSRPTTTRTYFVNGTTAAGCVGVASTTVTISPAPVNASTSTPNELIFCVASGNTFPINVELTSAVTSATWGYSSDGVSYTNFTTATTVGSITFTPSTTGSSPTINHINTISGITVSGYSGPRFFRLQIVTNTCTYNYLIRVTDTKTAVPNAPTALQTTVCNGDFTTLSIGGVQGGLSVQWQSSTGTGNPPANNTFSNISGATSNTYTTPNLTALINYRAVIGSGSCAGTSGSTQISIVSAQAANTITPSASCTNGETNIVLNGSTISGGIYQWQRSTTSSSDGFSDIIGAISEDYTLPTNIVNTTTWYRRNASNGTCLNNTSTATPIYAPTGSNTISSASSATCGSSFPATIITGSTPTGGSGSYTYQWQYSTNGTSFTNVPSAGTSKDYTTSSQNTSYYYRRIASSSDCQTETSSTVFLKLSAIPTITVTPSTTLCAGQTLALTAGGGNSYSWSPGTDLNATTGGTVFTTPTTTRTYTVTGTDVNNCVNTASTTITMTSLPTTPTLSSSTSTICSGSSTNLNSFISSGGSNAWFSVPAANVTYQLSTPTAVVNQGIYYLYAVNNGCYSANSAPFTLSVADVTAPSLSQSSVAVCSPNTVNLTSFNPVANNATSLVWKTGSSSGSSNVSSPTEANAGTYYLYAYSSGGNCYGSASAPFTVTQNSLPTLSLSSSSQSICEPNTIDLTSKISSPNSSLTYNWYSSSANPPSTSNLIANPGAISTTGTYYVFVLDPETGCLSAAPEDFEATFNADPVLSLTSPNVGCAAASTSLNVAVTNGVSSPTYQWKIYNQTNGEWDNLSNGGVYSGATSTTLGISNNTGLDGSAYYCEVTASGCTTMSDVGVIGVSQPNVPTATVTHPTCTVTTGTIEVTSYPLDLTFSISDPDNYQSSTTFSGVTTSATDSTSYTLTAKDYLACTNSRVVKVGPQKPVPLEPVTTNASACVYSLPAGTVANNAGNTSFSTPVYKWYTVNDTDTSTNYQQRSTATSFTSYIMATTTHYVAIVHPTSGCESTRESITNTVIDPLSGYNPSVNDYVWKGGASADIDDWKTATNWYQFDGTKYWTVETAPSLNDNVFIPPTGGCVLAQPHVKGYSTEQFINLYIKPGGSLTIEDNGVVNVSGNWTNDGSFTGNGNATVNFVGSGNHSINGTSTTTFKNVVINKPLNSGDRSVLKLNVQAHIAGELTLTAGLFDINIYDINMDGRTINGGSSASYVQTTSTGRLQRDVTSSARIFPVGRSAYNPATLTNLGTEDKYSIRVVDKITDIGTSADNEFANPSDSAVVNRTWMIDENTIGGSNVTLRLEWNGDVEHRNQRFDGNAAYIAHFRVDSMKWENKGSISRQYNVGSGFVQTTGINNFSPFGISSPEGGIALPVIFLNATINCEENTFNWATASERNSSHFDVMYSEDGYNWRFINRVASVGNAIQKTQYSSPFPANLFGYLKLNQFDNDGTLDELITLPLNCSDNYENIIYPNPNNGSFIVSLNVKSNSESQISVSDIHGRTIVSLNQMLEEGLNYIPITINDFTSGVYFVTTNVNGRCETTKIILQK
jgi:hypothetical protein